MALSMSHVSAPKTRNPSKLVVGIMVAIMTAFVGLAGIANAASDKPTKEWCMQHGFKNYGQCVKVWAHSHGHGGGYGGYGGYGGHPNGNGKDHDHDGHVNNHSNNNGSHGHGNKGGTVTVNGGVHGDVAVTVHGNNNVITIIINYLFGSA